MKYYACSLKKGSIKNRRMTRTRFGDRKKRSMNFIQSSVSNTIEEKEHKGIILDRVDYMDHQANHCRAFFLKRGCMNFEKGVQF